MSAATGDSCLANARRKSENVARLDRIDAEDICDAGFVLPFHFEQQRLRVFCHSIAIDQTMMRIAEQHHVLDIVRQQLRPHLIATRSVGSGRYNMRDICLVQGLRAGDDIAEQISGCIRGIRITA